MKMSSHNLRLKIALLTGGICYLLSPALFSLMHSEQMTNAIRERQQREARNSSAFATMLGEFRTSLGDILFVKTERYLDSGIAYAPHIDAREMESTGAAVTSTTATSVADHSASATSNIMNEPTIASPEMEEAAGIKPGTVHVHHEDEAADKQTSEVATLIQTANNDFRGFIGNLQRKVKPWRPPSAPHHHTAGTELLPWYKLATLSDPHNVRNYMIGAWWLKTLRTEQQRKEAVKFLDEGLAANPEAYELYLMKGYVLREMDKPKEALKLFRKSANLAIKQRPEGGPDASQDWDMTDDEQMAAAMTMDVMMTRDMDSTGSAILKTKEYMRRMPQEGALKRMLGELEADSGTSATTTDTGVGVEVGGKR